MLDKFRETAITWDKATSRIYSPVTANAGDENGRKLVVQIVNGGQVEDLTGATLHLYWETRDKLHDGLDVFKAVDLKKGEFELSYTTGMLSNHGILNANLVLIDTVGRVVSERFKITVTEGIDNDAIQSENSFSSLTQALIDVSNLEQNYAPRLNDLTAQLQQTEQSLNAQLAQIKHKGTMFVAHRGLNNAYPENTLLAFEMACLAGYKVIELDIQPTSDGHLVVHHDLTVDRMTNGTGNVAAKTLAEIQALVVDGGVGATEYPNLKVPTLEESLVLFRKYNVEPMIELKVINSYTQLDTLVALLVKYGFEYNSSIISPVTYLIDEFRQRGGKSEALFLSPITTENTALLKSYGNCGYAADYTVVTQAVVDSVHADGLSIAVYTVNDTTVARNLRNWGADYITTDTIKEVI